MRFFRGSVAHPGHAPAALMYRPEAAPWKHLGRSVRVALGSSFREALAGCPEAHTSKKRPRRRKSQDMTRATSSRRLRVSRGDVSPPGCRHTKLTKLETRRRRTTNRQTFVSLVSLVSLASAPKTPAFPSTTMAADTFVVNVRTLPDALESEMYPHLTRFQRKTSETRGPEFRFRCAPTETVGELKKRIEGTRRPRERLVPHSLAHPKRERFRSALSTSSSSRVCPPSLRESPRETRNTKTNLFL